MRETGIFRIRPRKEMFSPTWQYWNKGGETNKEISVGEVTVNDSEERESVVFETGGSVRRKPEDRYFFYCSVCRRLSDPKFVLRGEN